MHIIVNGRAVSIVASGAVSYAEIIDMAGFTRNQTPSVTYRWQGEGDNSRSGILAPGQLVTPAEGMVFNVARTG